MKHAFLIILALLLCTGFVFASFPNSFPDSTQSILFPQQLLSPFSSMKIKEYEKQAETRLNFIQKLRFKLIQQQAKKREGTDGKSNAGNALGGFFLGLILLPIGVFIAYLLLKNKTVKT